MIDIVDPKFLMSAANVAGAPESNEHNEVVFMARSNVGKSSILNALTNHKGLAKVSATPGKTRLINYFDIDFLNRDDDSRMPAKFVDLPGFGYAKVSKSIKSDWEKNLTQFISRRKQIKVFVHLIDSRHTNLDIDHSVDDYLSEFLEDNQILLHVFTKIDKLNQKEKTALRKKFPYAILVSNSKKTGIPALRKIIYDLLNEETDDSL